MEEEIDLKNIFQMFWDRKVGIVIMIIGGHEYSCSK